MDSYFYKALLRTNDRLDAACRFMCKQKGKNARTTIAFGLLLIKVICLNEEVKDLKKKLDEVVI